MPEKNADPEQGTPKRPMQLARKTIYESRWVKLYVDRVRFPSGTIIEEHHVLEFDNDSVAAVVENESGAILFVKAIRYTTESAEWEIPAGKIEPGESILEAARREVLEESGYETKEHELIYSFMPITGIARHTFHVVRCKGTERTGCFDVDEVSDVRWSSLEEVRASIARRELIDGYSLTALLLHMCKPWQTSAEVSATEREQRETK